MREALHRVCLSLGSNLQPEQALPQAAARLRARFVVECVSRVWESLPVNASGPNFLNAALLLAAPHGAEELKRAVLRPLESQMGRVRGPDKNAPRPIDLDVVLWDGQVIDAQLWERAYLAVPLLDVWREPLVSPRGESLGQVAARLAAQTQLRPRPDVTLE